MSLYRTIGGVVYKNDKPRIINSLLGVEVDYYFMAKRSSKGSNVISLKLWSIIVDHEGLVYGMITQHFGEFQDWEKVIHSRIHEHLLRVGVDMLHAKRMVRDIEIKKDGHLLPYDYRTSDAIGIEGSNQLYIRKSKFTYLK